ncbi:MAG: DHH family phosphoesterase [Oscillospiraceae bacterium]
MNLSINETAAFLREHNRYLIITHASPDGDTLGSGFGLWYALHSLGKQARVVCSDEIPQKFSYLLQNYKDEAFEPETIVAVDLAAEQLFGERLRPYADQVDLCIDHHPSNTRYAKRLLLDPGSAATCEIMLDVVEAMEAALDQDIARCLYTGLSTDTGCFKYSNVSPRTHRSAARLMETGIDCATINRLMFDTKTQNRLKLERMVLERIEYYFDGRLALIAVTQEMLRKSGVPENETEGIASLPRQIEGVDVGVMLKEKETGGYKVSLRTSESVNASEICSMLGGGGHMRAAGCFIPLPLEEAKQRLLEAVSAAYGEKL